MATQIVAEVTEEFVEIYPYRFNVADVEAGRRVFVGAFRLDGVDVGGTDTQNVKVILEDMGKWEALMDAAANVLEEVGIKLPQTRGLSEYAPKRYIFTPRGPNPQWDSTSVGFFVNLEKEERTRRERMKTAPLAAQEIASQLRNVSKWKSVSAALRLLRS